jgi:hypothetical protein
MSCRVSYTNDSLTFTKVRPIYLCMRDHIEVLSYMQLVARIEFGGPVFGPLVSGFVKGVAEHRAPARATTTPKATAATNGAASTVSSEWIPSSLRLELSGIATHTSKVGFCYSDLLLLNIGYDTLARCTSAVIQRKNGSIVHVRNMDWDCEPLRHMTGNY